MSGYFMNYGDDWPPAPEPPAPKRDRRAERRKRTATRVRLGIVLALVLVVIFAIVTDRLGMPLDTPIPGAPHHGASVTTSLPPQPTSINRR